MKIKPTFKTSRKTAEDYFLWRVERSIPTVKKINSIRSLNKLNILDLGCGYGSLSKTLGELGAQVTSAEVNQKSLEFAKKFLSPYKNVKIVKIGKEKLPFKSQKFDIVFLFDVIEHVKNPKTTIEESLRVLKKGGLLIVEFTPYYSIVGHHLYDYTKFPVQILPKNMVKNMIYSRKIDSFLSQDEFYDVFLSLNKLRISKFQEMVKITKKVEEKYIIKYPNLFEVNIPLLKHLGPLKDVFTMSFEGIYQKNN
ncbi:hypothetical protein COW99_01850 [Candidatus Roizmanbacteria bacterium CG22_combo_CG10-13_8_21_14_all_38_20]|uniref:Methyltransferase type 11 domain-containing protein n=1 Tax=Candidatus Roizmanbacteria bacterium CG22_combo_CG10-13_8_21_14_all_38_20 TaxID=1974862 RepID=A0A2H0BYB4_9BACT|nr:class I SAM-dependent methyltransferase [Candidatus Microgenomates bacterium]PIP61948.1 MAG: hypothetical protein COW99_01850 [Candidatus Roizmanbacteria bacterium CG22_combo_CG10-13_8_21_14_all_38_20]PJC32077.1 MAG: hypothetical protein CO050_01105 [Candidatus Roizmanbacteria bacterium CG_4_9_14_0_2_um_filter_38_17]